MRVNRSSFKKKRDGHGVRSVKKTIHVGGKRWRGWSKNRWSDVVRGEDWVWSNGWENRKIKHACWYKSLLFCTRGRFKIWGASRKARPTHPSRSYRQSRRAATGLVRCPRGQFNGRQDDAGGRKAPHSRDGRRRFFWSAPETRPPMFAWLLRSSNAVVT